MGQTAVGCRDGGVERELGSEILEWELAIWAALAALAALRCVNLVTLSSEF